MVLPVQAHRLELDGDAPLALEVHRVEVLGPHLAGIDRPAELEHAVGQRRLAMIDMGDDRHIADAFDGRGRVAGAVHSENLGPPGAGFDASGSLRGFRRIERAASMPRSRTAIDAGAFRGHRGQHQEPDQTQSAEREAPRAQQGGQVRAQDAHQVRADPRRRRGRRSPPR